MSDIFSAAASTGEAYSGSDFVRAQLWQEPFYPEDRELWKTLLTDKSALRTWFRQTGLELVIDEVEGYAFLRQFEPDEPNSRRGSSLPQAA